MLREPTTQAEAKIKTTEMNLLKSLEYIHGARDLFLSYYDGGDPYNFESALRLLDDARGEFDEVFWTLDRVTEEIQANNQEA